VLQNRLLESLAKFQEYEDTLESIMRNLDAFDPLISEEVESPVNLKVAQQQLETARVRLLHFHSFIHLFTFHKSTDVEKVIQTPN
jgi:hypothetical protein